MRRIPVRRISMHGRCREHFSRLFRTRRCSSIPCCQRKNVTPLPDNRSAGPSYLVRNQCETLNSSTRGTRLKTVIRWAQSRMSRTGCRVSPDGMLLGCFSGMSVAFLCLFKTLLSYANSNPIVRRRRFSCFPIFHFHVFSDPICVFTLRAAPPLSGNRPDDHRLPSLSCRAEAFSGERSARAQ